MVFYSCMPQFMSFSVFIDLYVSSDASSITCSSCMMKCMLQIAKELNTLRTISYASQYLHNQ